MEQIHPDVSKVILSEEDIKGIVTRMGAQITKDYAGKNPLLIAVLRGAVVFMGDLMRTIDCPLGIDFMAVSSYGDGAVSSGVVRIVKDLDTKIEGRDVLIVEDILDSGLTLKYLMKNLPSLPKRITFFSTAAIPSISSILPGETHTSHMMRTYIFTVS